MLCQSKSFHASHRTFLYQEFVTLNVIHFVHISVLPHQYVTFIVSSRAGTSAAILIMNFS